ncbi:MAG TPA: DUF3857 domain-containing protein, partial [Chryseosolibacter sp.]
MRALATFLFCAFVLPLYAKTSAVLDSSVTRITVKGVDKMSVTEFRRWEIRDKDGYRYCVFNDYENAFRKVKSLRYTIYDANGNRVKRFGLGDAMDVQFNAPYEVTDSRMLYLDPDYRGFPFSVEIETVVVCDQFLDFPDWMPRYSYNMEVKFATLELECPSGYRFRCKSFNGKIDSTTVQRSGERTYVWTLRNLEATGPYLHESSFGKDQPRVSISPFEFSMGGVKGSYSSWAEFGDWYLALNKEQSPLSEKTKQDLRGIRQKSADERELIRNVYKYMQQKTRYVSIQLGIGGFKALPVEKVDRNGYGDCKALSQYMHVLLTEVGVSSNYVLAKAGSDASDVVADFPSNQFNHIFVAVPLAADTTWLECTSQITPASYLGRFTDDRNVLWIAPGKSGIIRTPCFTAPESVCKSASVVRLDPEGNAVMTVSRRQGGFYFDEMAAYNSMSASQQERFNSSKFSYPDFVIGSFKYSVLGADRLLALDFGLKVNSLARRAGDRLLLPLNIFQPVDG